MDLVTSRLTYERGDVPLFYYNIKNFSPATVLNIVDVADSIPENNQDFNLYERIEPKVDSDPREYLLPHRFRLMPTGTLIMTDIATESKYVDYSIPLFYQHQLMYDHYSSETAYPQGYITVRKNNQSTVDQKTYIVQNRSNPVSSGRYGYDESGDFRWGSQLISGNVITARILLPSRKTDKNFYTVEYNRYLNQSQGEYTSELISERRMYEEGRDYTITPSSIVVPADSRAISGTIFVQKDYNSYVKINHPAHSSDKYRTKEWEFSVNTGNFLAASGMLNGGRIKYYTNGGGDVYMPTTDEEVKILPPNMIKVKHAPLIPSSSNKPNYSFGDVFEKLNINGVDAQDNIKSIDFNRGVVMLNKELNSSDNVTATYNSNNFDIMVVRNVQLNPALPQSGVLDVASSGVGIAIVPSGTTFYDADSNAVTDWSNIALYALSENTYGDFTTTSIKGWGASPYAYHDESSDYIRHNSVSGVIPSGSRFLGSVTINVSPEQNLDLVDIRRTGGYDEDQLIQAISGWRGYADTGYWDGEPMPMANVVIIQIPSGIYNGLYDVFSQDDTLTEAPIKNQKTISKMIDPDAEEINSTSTNITRATNKYIKDTVERYLPVGVQYILVDENMNFWGASRSDV